MTKALSRRQFLKAAAAGGATAAFAPLFGLNARPVAAKPSVPERVMQAAAAATQPFAALPSNLPLGTSLTDISMGWDGTLWGIDNVGVPYSYDQLSQTWEVYVHQIDAITYVSRWQNADWQGGDIYNGNYFLPLVVMGAQITSTDGSPLALSDAFANLPDSFQLGLDGIAQINQQLYLFRHGRYVIVDTSTTTNAVVGNPVALTSLANWPTSDPTWAAGTFQALGSCYDDPSHTIVHLFNNGQMLVVDFSQNAVILQQSYSDYANGTFRQLMNQGFSAVTFSSQNGNYPKNLYQGALQWSETDSSGNGATPVYNINFGANAGWTPELSQAPSGSASELWGVSFSRPVVNRGSGWQFGPYDSTFENCIAVSAGADGSVFCLTGATDGSSCGLRQLQSTGTWSAPLFVTPTSLVQLTVGDANHIWMRDKNNVVYRYSNGSISTLPNFVSATDIAANPDGTVWAANNDGNAYRFISEGAALATAIPVDGTALKMASNAFGIAVALVQNGDQIQAYTYDSPQVWKTGLSYFSRFSLQQFPYTLAVAGHTLFAYASNPSHTLNDGLIVALDTQTGNPLWPQPFTIPTQSDGHGGTLVYDSALNLVYLSSEGSLYALDGTSGLLLWSLEVGNSFSDSGQTQVLALNGSRLAVGLSNGTVALLDTTAAYASAQNNQPVSLLWTSPASLGEYVVMGAPTFDSTGTVYVQGQVQGTGLSYQPLVQALDPSTGATLWTRTDLPSITYLDVNEMPVDIVYGATIPANGSTGVPALFVNAGTGIYALNPADGTTLNSYALLVPSNSNNKITTSLSYQSGRLYFGDLLGKLYVLDATTLKPITQTSDTATSMYGVLGRVALISNNNGASGVVAAFTRGDQNVYLFDPDSGNESQIATDLTAPASLAYDSTHGLLYTMGWNYSMAKPADPNLIGQVFALRPDQAIQDERAFIIESQLMQDYHNDDEVNNTNGSNGGGNGNARYQTHVTIVDHNNVPMSNTSVKLWAEEDTTPPTTVSIDGGAPVEIGTNTPALFTTDASGSFTIISGGFDTSTNKSDATDLFAVTLQVWAAFMDASERIVITPDAEFHGRVSATTASGNTVASQADPSGIDLSSAQTYSGPSNSGTSPLFASDSDNQAAATAMASAMTQVTGATGVSASGTTAQLRRTLGGRLLRKQATATPPKYHAYTDLPGMNYSPVSALISQSLNPTTPLGISFTSEGGHQIHTPGEAADIIDAMQGDASNGQLGGFFSFLRDAWNDIKKATTAVKNAAISIAKEIYVGITYVVDGATKVIKGVAADIKDAMVAIGAFFRQIGKDIEDVIEALSILLHFEQFIHTQQYIKKQYTAIVGDPSNNIPGKLSDNVNRGFAKILSYLENIENTIGDDFNNIIGKLQGSPSTGVSDASSTWGSYTNGQSPHSMMTVGPADNASTPKKSVAVQGMWAAHKARQNAQSTTIPTSLTDSSDPIVNALVGAFTNNPDAFSNLDNVKSQFAAGIKVTSPQAFFDGLFADVLVLLKAALLAGVDALTAVVTALQGVSDAIIAVIQAGGPIYIPIITPLWNVLRKVLKFLPDFDITIIDVITLIAALPVTLIYRVVSGDWLSNDVKSVTASAVNVTPPQWLANAEGVITSMITLVNGIITGISDTLSVVVGNSSFFLSSPWVTIAGFASMGAMMLSPIYNATAANGNAYYDLVIAENVITNIISIYSSKTANAADPIMVWLLAILTLTTQGVADGTYGQPALTIVSDILANIPGCLAICKEVSDPASIIPFISPLADVTFGVAAAALALAPTILSWSGATETREYRLLMPVVVKS